MKYSPIKIPFMHTMWFLINMTEYILCWKTVFKIEFHAYGDKEFLVRELLNIRITDNKYRICDLSSTTPY
jgi:hypothetical protein